MPQSTDSKYNDDIDIRSDFSFPIASKREIEIVAEPVGERDMPSCPKILEGSRQIRFVEISAQFEPEQTGCADGDLRIGRKVKVELEGEENGGHQGGKTVHVGDIPINGIDINGQPVSNYNLFEKSDGNKEQPFACGVIIKFFWRGELRQKVACPLNGACDKLRKEGEEGEKGHHILCRLKLPVVDIQHIAQPLEGIEADAYRQDDVQRSERG